MNDAFNLTLIEQIGNLEKEVKDLREKIADLERCMSEKRPKVVPPYSPGKIEPIAPYLGYTGYSGWGR